MNQFDYLVKDVDADDLQSELQQLGKDRWELVTVLTFSQPFDDIVSGYRVTGSDLKFRLVLKRILVN